VWLSTRLLYIRHSFVRSFFYFRVDTTTTTLDRERERERGDGDGPDERGEKKAIGTCVIPPAVLLNNNSHDLLCVSFSLNN